MYVPVKWIKTSYGYKIDVQAFIGVKYGTWKHTKELMEKKMGAIYKKRRTNESAR